MDHSQRDVWLVELIRAGARINTIIAEYLEGGMPPSQAGAAVILEADRIARDIRDFDNAFMQ